MPEAKYSFKPVASVRTFGEILAHVAGANYIFCAAAKGEKSPHAEDAFEKTATTAPAIIKALQESIVYCDAAYTALDDRQCRQKRSTAPFGGGKTARAAALMGNTGHLQEHYGNLVTYLRINGLVPPLVSAVTRATLRAALEAANLGDAISVAPALKLGLEECADDGRRPRPRTSGGRPGR